MEIRPYRIALETARQAIEAGQALVLDLTSPFIEPAVRARIPGARWIAPREVLDRNRRPSQIIEGLGDALAKDKTIIAYCTCPDDEASRRLTRVLRAQGYDAWVLEGGLPAWRAAGYPMEANLAAA
jgi:ArsR family transcriptional regulator